MVAALAVVLSRPTGLLSVNELIRAGSREPHRRAGPQSEARADGDFALRVSATDFLSLGYAMAPCLLGARQISATSWGPACFGDNVRFSTAFSGRSCARARRRDVARKPRNAVDSACSRLRWLVEKFHSLVPSPRRTTMVGGPGLQSRERNLSFGKRPTSVSETNSRLPKALGGLGEGGQQRRAKVHKKENRVPAHARAATFSESTAITRGRVQPEGNS